MELESVALWTLPWEAGVHTLGNWKMQEDVQMTVVRLPSWKVWLLPVRAERKVLRSQLEGRHCLGQKSWIRRCLAGSFLKRQQQIREAVS